MARYSSQFPDPVALVTVAAKDKTNVMAVGWTSPISFNPPILMVSIAPPRFTHDLLLEAGEFGVSILAEDQKELSTFQKRYGSCVILEMFSVLGFAARTPKILENDFVLSL